MKVEAASGVEPAAAGSGLQRGWKTGERGTFHTRFCSALRNEEPSAQRWDGRSSAGPSALGRSREPSEAASSSGTSQNALGSPCSERVNASC